MNPNMMCFLSGFTESRFVSNHSLLRLEKKYIKNRRVC